MTFFFNDNQGIVTLVCFCFFRQYDYKLEDWRIYSEKDMVHYIK
ncbi:Conserved hypothetical protein [Clostridium acetobutylicum EA 2018]|uniref:Uncharacterized protein n=1 Tax=Clostridium acetobutylicum (strain ATCC 824 / DSM 792 / JCM 1419 / IAM 19013 / LMG 5710 / NBRC 13948 / NRRL B-527 / VKM B-1787 / 2291 / W) TaxID=272562 RepID=Q97HE1_CLOAB|nr:Hypothetical protein CA_C2070 [Clostridium acetobutylicum ATCC 824]ADZ21121.1 Conserved hypothetical protein [Clostridium acetobutylicum EA 2018]AEI32169.1 hypothetical protein SMB_G2103 [Clostridium acetobutylicum DSM 1731]AWV79543.1 hypothetical protein DK921_05395 [Clostridium acetobutylicum]PSM07503.1 hypothetical protein C7T89_05395 [Clostridium sp. NJ4]